MGAAMAIDPQLTAIPTKTEAILCRRYGSPDVLTLERVDVPTPAPEEVLVEVVAVSVHAGDWHLVRADPFLMRLLFGLTRPKSPLIGGDFAGVVRAVGRDVRELSVGDRVFGDVSNHSRGAFTRWVSAPASFVAKAPTSIPLEEAAAVPVSAVTALQGLRDVGELARGERVLINGASGGVGSFAVQIAKALGAKVTAVGGPHSLELLRSLGADEVLDYTQIDFAEGGARFDLILDAAAYRSFFKARKALRQGGRYVCVGGSTRHFFQAMIVGPIASMDGRSIRTMEAKPNAEDLRVVAAMTDAGELRPAIGERFDGLASVPEALRHIEGRHHRGKTIVVL
ncbi:MAG: NAD(P)-dependent alcohol dehydrogenase [Myxococcota bacterium]